MIGALLTTSHSKAPWSSRVSSGTFRVRLILTRSALTSLLADSEHEALYWETVPSSFETRDRTFEMVVLPSQSLGRRTASSDAFAAEIGRPGPSIRSFPNLGRDALLVVPTAMVDDSIYGHLAAFVRGAPADQVDALWEAVGEAIEERWAANPRPLWVSTAGDGVPWLHVRLDQRPKYYGHTPYRRP